MFKNFLRKSCLLLDNVEKYDTAGEAIDENMAHAHCMLDNEGYKHTLTICNTYRLSNATMVARKRLDVTLYVTCLSCLSRMFIDSEILGGQANDSGT